MRQGRTVAENEASVSGLDRLRERAAGELKRLHDELLGLDSEVQYAVGFSDRLENEREKVERHLSGK